MAIDDIILLKGLMGMYGFNLMKFGPKYAKLWSIGGLESSRISQRFGQLQGPPKLLAFLVPSLPPIGFNSYLNCQRILGSAQIIDGVWNIKEINTLRSS